MKELNVALLGLGTVGSGVVKIIEENREQIRETMNKDINIRHILVRDKSRKRPINTSKYNLTEDIEDIFNDDSIDIIVEVLGGVEPTVEWLKRALSEQKHVITANKDLLAENLRELEHLAQENDVALKYEASVAGGIPIVNAINNGLNANNISKFMGILNGTSNFILSKMTQEETSFEEALAEAQRLGFAEADPTDDVEGVDAARKVVITSYLSFNQVINLDEVDRYGSSDVTLPDIKVADKLGYKIKLIGKGTYENAQVNASVAPTLIDKSNQLASVEDEFNAIYVIGDAVGETMFYGKGAGSIATGSAVVSDLLNVTFNFDTNLHTLPPHIELKTEETKEMMKDQENTIVIKGKESYYVVVQTDGEDVKQVETLLKGELPVHKSLVVAERDAHTAGVVIIGIDESPIATIQESGYVVQKIYPVEGV